MILLPRSFKNCTANSVIGPRVSKAIGLNILCDPDNTAYLACFLDVAISAVVRSSDEDTYANV